MGVGLSLLGRYEGTPTSLVRRVAPIVRTWAGGDLVDLDAREGEEQAWIGIQLHPAAERVELRIEPGRVEASAKTSTVGPGYHAWVCELFDALKATGIVWTFEDEEHDDETGFFRSRDVAALERAMLTWLRSLASTMRDSTRAGGGTGWQISLSLDHVYEHDGAIATPLGPRDLAWLERVAEDPTAGTDVFPWWEQGRGAGYELGRALCRIWTEVRFRNPDWLEDERVIDDVLERLARAFALDPARDYPWSTWAELLELAGGEHDVARIVSARAREDRRPPLGYRRRPVRRNLGGFSVRIPGDLSEQVDEEGTWSAWHDERTVWASVFRARDPNRRGLPTGDPPEGRAIALSLGDELLSRAGFTSFEEDGERLWKLVAEVASVGKMLLLTVVVPEERDLEWALEIASSVQG